jgi:hypothetical protein
VVSCRVRHCAGAVRLHGCSGRRSGGRHSVAMRRSDPTLWAQTEKAGVKCGLKVEVTVEEQAVVLKIGVEGVGIVEFN